MQKHHESLPDPGHSSHRKVCAGFRQGSCLTCLELIMAPNHPHGQHSPTCMHQRPCGVLNLALLKAFACRLLASAHLCVPLHEQFEHLQKCAMVPVFWDRVSALGGAGSPPLLVGLICVPSKSLLLARPHGFSSANLS